MSQWQKSLLVSIYRTINSKRLRSRSRSCTYFKLASTLSNFRKLWTRQLKHLCYKMFSPQNLHDLRGKVYTSWPRSSFAWLFYFPFSLVNRDDVFRDISLETLSLSLSLSSLCWCNFFLNWNEINLFVLILEQIKILDTLFKNTNTNV